MLSDRIPPPTSSSQQTGLVYGGTGRKEEAGKGARIPLTAKQISCAGAVPRVSPVATLLLWTDGDGDGDADGDGEVWERWCLACVI